MIFKEIKAEHIYEMLPIEETAFRDPWDYKILYEEIRINPNSNYIGLFNDDELVAYIGYWFMVDYFDIANLAVKEEYKNQGLASKLLVEVERLAKEENVNNIFLEVSVHNEAAINLYLKHNYKKLKVIKNYYTVLKEDAFLMQKEVNNG